MAQHETLLETVQRYVVEGEERVTKQTALVAELARDGHSTTRAEAQLTILKDTLYVLSVCEILEREREAKAAHLSNAAGEVTAAAASMQPMAPIWSA